MSAPSGSASPLQSVREFVGSRVSQLQRGYLNKPDPLPSAVAELARLRRPGAAVPGRDPLVWSSTFGDIPAVLLPPSGPAQDAATDGERAVHGAIFLYANHQQSGDRPVHRPGTSFGAAVGRLSRQRADGGDSDAGTLRRFQIACTAHTFERRIDAFHGLVRLMRSAEENIAFDYGRFAADLYRLQRPGGPDAVRLSWARDLYRRPVVSTTTDQSAPTPVNGAY